MKGRVRFTLLLSVGPGARRRGWAGHLPPPSDLSSAKLLLSPVRSQAPHLYVLRPVALRELLKCSRIKNGDEKGLIVPNMHGTLSPLGEAYKLLLTLSGKFYDPEQLPVSCESQPASGRVGIWTLNCEPWSWAFCQNPCFWKLPNTACRARPCATPCRKYRSVIHNHSPKSPQSN